MHAACARKDISILLAQINYQWRDKFFHNSLTENLASSSFPDVKSYWDMEFNSVVISACSFASLPYVLFPAQIGCGRVSQRVGNKSKSSSSSGNNFLLCTVGENRPRGIITRKCRLKSSQLRTDFNFTLDPSTDYCRYHE